MKPRLKFLFRTVAILCAWSLSCAATSPDELMPPDGRAKPFGQHADTRLTVAVGDDNVFGEVPDLSEDALTHWRLSWIGAAYDIFDEDSGNLDVADARLAFRKLRGTRRLYVAQLRISEGEGGPSFLYILLWRASKREFVGFRDFPFNNGQCGELDPSVMTALGMSADDIGDCTVHTWPQVEGVMRAYAQTRPEPIGTIRAR